LAHTENKVARQSKHFKRKREDKPVPSQHHTSEKTSDLVWISDPHESGQATKAGHELEAAGQKRTRQTTDDLDMSSEEAEAAALDRTKWKTPYAPLDTRRYKYK